MTKLRLFQEFIAIMLRGTLLPVLAREVIQKNKVTIITYHQVEAPLFEKHLLYLLKRYSIIALDDFIRAWYRRNLKVLPARSLIITFDDGARTNHSLKETLQKYHVPATIFACAGIIGTNRHFWFTYRKRVQANIKRISDFERLQQLEKIGFKEFNEYDNAQALSDEEALELLKAGVSIQSHTLTHPILPNCDDVKAEKEISLSKSSLQRKFGMPVICLAFPNGDYSPRDIGFCRKTGYLAAVTMDPGFNDGHSDIYKLKRISIHDQASVNQLAVRASGVWGFARQMLLNSRPGFVFNQTVRRDKEYIREGAKF